MFQQRDYEKAESNNTTSTTTTTTTRAATRLMTTTAKAIIAVRLLFRLLHDITDSLWCLFSLT